jgi:hypothetical protein
MENESPGIQSDNSSPADIVELDQIETEMIVAIDYVNYVEADIEQEPYLINDGIPCGVDNTIDVEESGSMNTSDSRLSTPCVTCNCNFLFRKMDLTERQKLQLRRAMHERENCIKNARERLANLFNKYMEEYKLAYQRIHRLYRAGKITEAEYKRLLHRLNMKYREIFSNLKDRKLMCKAIAHCHRQYLGRVQSILTPRQWHAFVTCQKRCIAASNHSRPVR